VRNALNDTGSELEIEGARSANSNPRDVGSGFLACGHDSLDHITGLKAVNGFGAHEVTAEETTCCYARAFVGTTAMGGEQQGRLLPASYGCDRAHVSGAEGVQGVSLGDGKPMAVVFGASAAAGGDRQAGCDQSVEEGPAGGVDGCGIGQRLMQLPFDVLDPSRVFRKKGLDGLAALLLVAGDAGEGEVADPVGAASSFGTDVIDVERNVLRIAVGALPAPLFEQVLAQLIAHKGAILVLGSRDLRVFDELHIEAHQFLNDRGDRSDLSQPSHCRGHRVDAVLKRWRNLAFRLMPVVESGSAIAQVGAAPPSAEAYALLEGLTDRSPTVFEFKQGHYSSDGGGLVLAHDGDAGLFGAGIDLEREVLGDAAAAVDQANGEGVHLVDAGAASVEEKPCTLFRARHEGLLVFGENEYGHAVLLSWNCPYGPCDAPLALVSSRRLPSGMLRSGICHRPFRALPGLSASAASRGPD